MRRKMNSTSQRFVELSKLTEKPLKKRSAKKRRVVVAELIYLLID